MLLTKPAIPGRVKTRLIGELTPEQAAELQDAFMADLLERLAGGDFTLEVAWALDPGEPLPQTPWGGFRQQGGDLGERLFHALATGAEGHDLVAAIGSDHPELPLSHIRGAFEKLAGGSDVVLGPTTDGGYYLVGATKRSLSREIFTGIDWSTERVLTATLQKCRNLGLSVELLPMGEDVDTPADLRRLVTRLAAGDYDCPRTIGLLEAWRRISL